ncbi:MAG: hypothetical protein IT434_12885 [Phycisphaerales bacterium]|nr:hypothetical protein [Phycisphaerales bacterium]
MSAKRSTSTNPSTYFAQPGFTLELRCLHDSPVEGGPLHIISLSPTKTDVFGGSSDLFGGLITELQLPRLLLILADAATHLYPQLGQPLAAARLELDRIDAEIRQQQRPISRSL